jgi:hypothetical protein
MNRLDLACLSIAALVADTHAKDGRTRHPVAEPFSKIEDLLHRDLGPSWLLQSLRSSGVSPSERRVRPCHSTSETRLAYELLLQVGHSRCDVVRMGRQHVRNGTGTSNSTPVFCFLSDRVGLAERSRIWPTFK